MLIEIEIKMMLNYDRFYIKVQSHLLEIILCNKREQSQQSVKSCIRDWRGYKEREKDLLECCIA